MFDLRDDGRGCSCIDGGAPARILGRQTIRLGTGRFRFVQKTVWIVLIADKPV